MADIAFSRADDLIFGNGELYVSIDGDDVEWRHLGNVDEFTITTTLEDVEKYSSLNMKRELMAVATTQASVTASATLTEYDYHNISMALFGNTETKKQNRLSYVDYVCKIKELPNIITVYDDNAVRCFGITGVKMRPKTNPYPCVHWVEDGGFGYISKTTVYNDTFVSNNFGGKISIDMASANITSQFSIYLSITKSPDSDGDLYGMRAQIYDGSDATLKDIEFNSGTSETITLNSGIEITFSVDGYSTFRAMTASVMNGIKALAIPPISEFKENVDFVVDAQCKRAGLIKIPKSSRIRAGDEVYASCVVPERELKVVHGGTNREILGKLLYVPDNSIGPNYVIEAWKVQIKPEGDLTGLISSGDFGSYKINFTFMIDYENHPDSPYYSMTLVDYAKNNLNESTSYDSEY